MSHSTRAERPAGLKITIDRGCLVILTVAFACAGFWAYLAPASWHDDFPGFGLSWLPRLGPYNEHLARDTGTAFLTLAVFSALALWRVTDVLLTRVAGATWLVFNGLHLGYHVTMLHMYGLRDQLLSMLSLGFLVVLSAVLLLPAPRPSALRQEGESAAELPG